MDLAAQQFVQGWSTAVIEKKEQDGIKQARKKKPTVQNVIDMQVGKKELPKLVTD